jgi:hypothetical protein
MQLDMCIIVNSVQYISQHNTTHYENISSKLVIQYGTLYSCLLHSWPWRQARLWEP